MLKTNSLVTLSTYLTLIFLICDSTHKAAFHHWRSSWRGETKKKKVIQWRKVSTIGVSSSFFQQLSQSTQLRLPRTRPVCCALSPRPHLQPNPEGQSDRRGMEPTWKKWGLFFTWSPEFRRSHTTAEVIVQVIGWSAVSVPFIQSEG